MAALGVKKLVHIFSHGAMWLMIKFYNIIIKSANMDMGGGVNSYSQNVDKCIVF